MFNIATLFVVAMMSGPQHPVHIIAPPDVSTYCAVPTPRHRSTKLHFQHLTGFPSGRAGYVVDHIVPLCACGPDSVDNMQWSTIKEAKVKDREEKSFCAKLRRHINQ